MQSRGNNHWCIARIADLVALVHVAVVLVAAFGWWLMPLHPLHALVLALTLISWLTTGSCVLSQLEYRLRKRYLLDMQPYESGYLHFHLRKLTGVAPSLPFIRAWGYVYLTLALILWIVTAIMESGMLA
jgi:hypothetical protein